MDPSPLDPRALMEAVAETYRGLETLAVEILATNESQDDHGFNHREQRAKAFFAAPDRVRLEQGGPRGTITATNGSDLHHYFGRPQRYSKTRVQPSFPLPGLFRPDVPMVNDTTFLFSQIAQRVADARILREETLSRDGQLTPCQVLEVTHEPAAHSRIVWFSSPLVFWVDSRTSLIAKLEAEVTHRHPAREEDHVSKWILAFRYMAVNEPIPSKTFEFVPPPDAVDISDARGGGGGRMSLAGGGGSVQYRGGNRLESWHSHDWAGVTLVEHLKYKVWGMNLAFERRLSLSEDRQELHIVDRITGPGGQTEREFSVSVA
jgi:hypothetical protein